MKAEDFQKLWLKHNGDVGKISAHLKRTPQAVYEYIRKRFTITKVLVPRSKP